MTHNSNRFHIHSHGFYEIYTYLGGEGIYLYFVGDTIYELVPGDVVITRPGTLHATFKKEKVRYSRMYVRIDRKTAAIIADIDPAVYRFLKSGTAHIHPTGVHAEEFAQLTERVRAIYTDKSRKGRKLQLLSCILEQLAILCRAASAMTERAAPSENDLIRRIISYVNENFAAITSIADVAEVFNYSKNHLSALFRREMNISLHDFIQQKRLAVAAARLATGESVTDCAMECGFSSPSHFISVFKKAYGMTPKEYQGKDIVHI